MISLDSCVTGPLAGSGESDNLRHNVVNCPIQPLWNFRRESSRAGNSTYAKPRSPGALGKEKVGRGHFRNQMLKRVLPALRAYAPDLILISAGFDGAERDLGNSVIIVDWCHDHA
jgi:hypothetical protein